MLPWNHDQKSAGKGVRQRPGLFGGYMSQLDTIMKRFNISALEQQVHDHFKYMVVVEPYSSQDYSDWCQKADPEGANSRYELVPRKGGSAFDRELDVIMFKSPELADNFISSTNIADRGVGIVQCVEQAAPEQAKIGLYQLSGGLRLSS